MTEAPWVDGKTFNDVLRQTATRFGDRDAVVFPRLGLRWSYAEFERQVRATAKALMASRVGIGDHVGVWATNWPEWILLQFGTGLIGAVLVNVNPAYRTHEFAYILKQADIKQLFITDKHKTSDYEAMVAELLPSITSGPAGKRITSAEYPKLAQVVSIKPTTGLSGALAWQAFIAQGARVPDARLNAVSAEVRAGDPVNIQYTSGTTGNPKGAMLSHRNLLMNAFYAGERQRITEKDRVCIPVPFYHCFGCVLGTLMSAVHGAAMVVPAESFDPEATLAAVAQEKCTALYGVPTMFNAEINHPDFAKYDLSSLRTGIMAGSPCPIELMKRVVSEMHCSEVTIAYGQTEASPIVTQSTTTDPLDVRVSTVGSELPGVEARIVDPATGKDCAPGEQGEFWARGHGIMLGYYNLPEATAAAIDKDGWLHSGDLAVKTPAGHYKITGRIKDMIIRGGENIYPREIEEFLLTHPKIRDVQVVGVPDEKFGEQVSAWIVPKEPGTVTEDEVKAYCKQRIAHYKVPHYVVFVEEFPLTVTGKVQKFKLREMGVERFGLEKAVGIKTA